MKSPTVITSKLAQNDYNKIMAAHADLVTSYAGQSAKVAAYRDQKAVEQQNKDIMQAEAQKEQMATDTQVAKNSQDFAIRQGELDVKRAALSAV